MSVAIIAGEVGGAVEWTEFQAVDDDHCKVKVTVKSKWYEASVKFESSIGRVERFVHALDALLRTGSGNANFINENGNFDFDVALSSRGSVRLSGVLSENMIDDLQLKFGVDTDRVSLERFKDAVHFALQEEGLLLPRPSVR